jgi:hypothetical protein
MQEQIQIGVQGNDGTGDSIRDAFRKVNANFTEIYAIFNQGGRITFSDLADGCDYSTVDDVLVGNQIIMGNATGTSLTARKLVKGNKFIDINITDTSIVISSKASQLSEDETPEIKYPFNANGFPIGRVPDPSDALVQSFNTLWAPLNVTTTLDELVVNVGYANKNYVRLTEDGTIGIVDSNGSIVPGPVSARNEPIAPDTSAGSTYDSTLTSNYLPSEVLPRKNTIYRGGDTMTGPLYLHDHPKELAGIVGIDNKDDLQAATAFYVDKKTFSSNVNLYIATSGDDLQSQTPAGKEGRFWNYAFRSVGAAMLHAESLINVASQEPGPYKQRISYTISADQYFSKIQKVSLTGGNSSDSGYVAAFNLLQANKGFIQAEAIAYINKKYVNPFAYDTNTLKDKINVLLTNIGTDLVLGASNPDSATSGTNYNSYWEGVSYVHDNPTSDGLIQWVETVNFIRDQIIDFSYNTVALQAYTLQLINAIKYDALFKSNYQSVQTAIAFKNAGTNISAEQLASMLIINPISIKSAECDGSQITLFFNTQTSILYPVASEILINASLIGIDIASDAVTISSFNNSAVVSFVVTRSTLTSVSFSNTTLQLNAGRFSATGTIDRKNLINLLMLTPAIRNLPAASKTSLIISNINVIRNYVLYGTLPAVKYPLPANPAVGYDLVGHASAKQLLLENIAFIQAETLSFLSSKYPNVIYDRALSNRDIKYIIWSLVYDLTYGGNSQSVYAGKQFWANASSNFIKDSESEACIAAIRHVNVLAQSIIKNGTLNVSYQQSVRQYRNDTLSNGIVASLSVSSNITLIADILTDIANVPVSTTYPDITTGNSDLQTVYTGIGNTTAVYTTGPTTSTSWFMNKFYPVIDTEIKQTKIIRLFKVITDIIQSGKVPTTLPTFPALSSNIKVNTNQTITAAMIDQTRSIFTYSIINNIATNTELYVYDNQDIGELFYGVTYDRVKMVQELQNIVTALLYDITFGGDSALYRASQQYTKVGDAPGNTNGTTNIFNRVKTFATAQITANYSGTAPQLSAITALINDKVDKVVNFLTVASPTITLVNEDTFTNNDTNDMYRNAISLRNLIINNSTSIVNSTVVYVNTTFAGGFVYDESLCYRDLGFIIDSMCIDLITGGTWQAINSGKSFYKNASARTIAVGGTHYKQSLDGLQFAKTVALQVLNKETAVRYQSLPQLVSFSNASELPSTSIFVQGNIAANVASLRSVSFVDIGDLVVLTSHGLTNGTSVSFSSITTTTGIVTNTIYYVANATTHNFKLTTLTGNSVTLTLNGTGILNSNDSITKFTNSFDTVLNILQYGVGVAPVASYGTGIWHVCVNNGGRGFVDQGSPSNNDIFPAKVVLGVGSSTVDASDAYGTIVKYVPAQDTSLTIISIDSLTQFTLSVNHKTAGSITITVGTVTGLSATLSTGTAVVTLTSGNTAELSIGQTPTAITGPGEFGVGTLGNVDTVQVRLSKPGFFTSSYILSNVTWAYSNANIIVTSNNHTVTAGTNIIVNSANFSGSNTNAPTGSWVVSSVTTNTFSFTADAIPTGTSTTLTVVIQVGEELEFGETVRDLQITVFVESGIYYEDYPIRLPANVSIKGDEFRRTIIRPIDRISQSAWVNMFFYRDSIIDALEIGKVNYNGTDDSPVVSSFVSFTDTGDLVTLASHGLILNSKVKFVTISTTTGLTTDIDYYAIPVSENTFKVKLSITGSASTLTNNGTGIMTHYTDYSPVVSTNVSFTDSGDLITLVSHGFLLNNRVTFLSVNTTTGLTLNVGYFVIPVSINTFKVASVKDGSAVSFTNNGTGVISHNITASFDGVSNKIVVTLGSNYQALLSWVGRVIADTSTTDNKKRGRAVIDSVSGNTMNCTVIYPFDQPGIYPYSVIVAGVTKIVTWKLFDTNNYGRHYLTDPLDINSTPKNNKEIDVFLCNEGNRVLGMTFQGHGGFAMVLDPEGNIKTKSPYIQECSSFSQSNNYKRFAGGQLIDGFAGRLYGTITNIADQGLTVTVIGEDNSGLDVRPPQPPCSFYVRGNRYQIDDIASFDASTKTVVLTLDKSTTYMYDPVTHALTYDLLKAQRDVGFVLDAAITDAILGTNYRSIHAGRSFLRTYSSLLIGGLKDLTISGIDESARLANLYFANTSLLSNNIRIITGMISNGVNATPTITWPTSATSDLNKVRDIIQNNKEFIKTEISAWLAAGSSGYNISKFANYNVLTSERDTGYIIDAITYDIFFGGTSQTYDSAISFYYYDTANNIQSVIPDELELCKQAYIHLKSILQDIIANNVITKSSGNGVSQIFYTTLPTSTSTYVTNAGNLCDIIIDYVVDHAWTAIPSVAIPCKVVSATISGTQTGTYAVGNLLTVSGVSGVIAYVTAVSLTGAVTAVSFTRTGATAGNFTSTPASLTALATANSNISTGYGAGALLTLVIGPQYFPSLPTGDNTDDYGTVLTDISTIASSVTTFLNNGANLRINLETGGNRSMLANDFAMFNDLAYGILATNGAFTEQVCTFTYYAHTGLWANNGSNLRGVGCSNTFGNYGMRASGFDVTELPDSTNLANHMIQTAIVYKQGLTINEMTPTATTSAVSVWISGYDYKPTNGSTLEIDHTVNGGIITKYSITSVEYTSILIGTKTVLKLNLSASTSSTSAASAGLAKELYHGQVVTIRVTTNVKFNNIDNVKPTRPSTALQYNDNLNDVYRIVAYNLTESTGDLLDPNVAILQSDNDFAYYSFIVDPANIVNGDPSSNITASIVSGSVSSTTITVNNVVGIIEAGQTIVGIGFTGQIVSTVTGPISSVYTITLGSVTTSTANPTITPAGPVSFSFKTQGSKVSDTKIAVSRITQDSVIDQINKGTYITSWNGRLHRVLKYVVPTFAASRLGVEYNNTTQILEVSGNSGTIVPGTIIVSKVLVGGVSTVEFIGTVVSSEITVGNLTHTSITVLNGVGTVTAGSEVTFGVNNNGYLEISANAIINNSADGTGIPAMVFASSTLQVDSTVNKLVTFNIPYNKDNLIPKVDSFITISGNSNSNYNVPLQVTSIKDQTTLTLPSVEGYVPGMIITSEYIVTTIASGTTFTTIAETGLSTGDIVKSNTTTNGLEKGIIYYVKSTPSTYTFTLTTGSPSNAVKTDFISGTSLLVSIKTPTTANMNSETIVQSVDKDTNKIVVSPSCWAPNGSPIRAILAASVKRIYISDGGTGYTVPPPITIVGEPYTQQATASCNVVNGVITQINLIRPGSGYITTPTVQIGIAPNAPARSSQDRDAVIIIELTTPVYRTSIASTGETVTQLTTLFSGDPGVFGADTAATIVNANTGLPTLTTYNGVEGYSVAYNYSTLGSALTAGTWYQIAGNSSLLYNGFVQVISSADATHAVIFYPYNPGLYGTGTTTIVRTSTSGLGDSLGISKPFSKTSSYTLKLGYAVDVGGQVTTRISTCRATGHDFCDIGTGGYSTTNIPYSIYGDPALARNPAHETLDEGVGRCFYVSTNQDGIFRVGRFFSVDQGTGTVTFSAKISLSNIEGFGFSRGVVVNEFSSDSSLTNNASEIVPVQSAVRGYIDKRLGLDHGGSLMPFTSIIGPGFLPLNGITAMNGPINMNGEHRITGLNGPAVDSDAATKGYVDTQISSKDAVSKLGDVKVTSTPQSAQVLSYVIGPTDSGLSTEYKWRNKTIIGDITLSVVSETISGITYYNLTSIIGAGKIVNSMVSSTAAVDQSKLALTAAPTASTVPSSFVQANLGVASFNSNQFNATYGWIDLKNNGVALGKLAAISTGNVLGNNSGSSVAPTEISFGTVVTGGDGITNAVFGSGTTALTNYVMLASYNGTTTSQNTYSLIATTTTNDLRNRIVKTGDVGDINAEQYKIDGSKIIDTIGAGAAETIKVVFTTPGSSDFLTAVGNGTNLAPVVVKVLGTLDVSGNTINASTLNYSGTNLTGTISGSWTLPTGSTFDARQGTFRSSGAGLEASDTRPKVKPTVMFDFANSRTLDPRITFTRESIGTYYDMSGVMKVAIANQPRFTYNTVTRMSSGLLIEESRTNYIRYSALFTLGVITDATTWYDTRISRDPLSGVVAPDGTTAIKFTADSGTTALAPAKIMFQSAPAGGPIPRTFSIWIKRVSGTGSIQYTMDPNTPVIESSEPSWYTIPVTTTLTRYDFTDNTSDHGVGIKLETAGDSIVMWGAQLEDGGMVTSYIPTVTTIVTREADTVYVGGTNFSRWYNQNEGTILISQAATAIDKSITVKDYGGVFIENVNQSTTIAVGGLTTGTSSMIYKAVGKTNTSTTQFNLSSITTAVLNNEVTHAVAYRSTLLPVVITASASTTTTTTFTSIAVINGIFPGATIAVTTGVGSYPAGTYVVSVLGNTLVTSQAPSTTLSASVVITVTNAIVSYISNGDNATLVTDSASDIVDSVNPMQRLNIGNETGAQTISKIAYYPVRLNDAEITAITTQ